MSTMTWTKIPFKYRGEKDFYAELNTWMGEIFYERLPTQGYEIREEQIYTAYHMVSALQEKGVLFAEAGSGTGKTFAYLLSSLCYARLKGLPVILSSASPLLQDQLIGKEGDIATLSRELGLNIDARLAKHPEHYICEVKVDRLKWGPRKKDKKALLEWAEHSVHGERSEIPDINDETWSQAAWDKSLNCSLCRRRGYCRFTKARRDFQGATDFVVCEHEVFLSDLWDREELKEQRRLPYLPDYSAVVLDEGHLIELPLARSLGREINSAKLEHIVEGSTNVEERYQRDIVYDEGQVLLRRNKGFFMMLKSSIVDDPFAERLHIRRSNEILKATEDLRRGVIKFQDELVIEESMNEGTPFAVALASYQNQLDRLREGLRTLLSGDDASVTWWDPEEQSVWTLPRQYGEALHKELLSKDIPVIFTSATLASGRDFSYIQHITGARNSLTSQVEVPFDLEEQVVFFVPLDVTHDDNYAVTASTLAKDLIAITGGKTLVLCGSPGDVSNLRKHLDPKNLPFKVFWEGDSERGKLIEQFRSDKSSILIGSGFWEGVDVPGESLSQVIVFSLPFPQPDPLVEARRREAREKGLDPVATIDTPSMLIKLRQGFGRLIRTQADRGIISVIDSRPGTKIYDHIIKAIPNGVKVTHCMEELKAECRRVLG